MFALGIGTVLADNFEVYSGKKGCESIVKERERRDCQDLSRKKNDAATRARHATSTSTSARSRTTTRQRKS
jgi:hypothetical protein